MLPEFEEIRLNEELGYEMAADVVFKYPQFYWNNVAPQISTAIRYFNMTSSRRQWIAIFTGKPFVPNANCDTVGSADLAPYAKLCWGCIT